MEQIIHFFTRWQMTAVSGVCLLVSLTCRLTHTSLFIDPAWVSVIISGLPLLYAALYRLIVEHRITSALLITTAMTACLCIHELFAAGEVAFIMALGEMLEDYTVGRAKRGLGKLMALTPDAGRRLTITADAETAQMVPLTEIAVGDVLRVLPGERVPVDGVILKGVTTIDQSVMTGESLPVDKQPGDAVFCGTVNCFGAVDMRATKVGADSSLQKMIQLVRDAENHKAPMQRIADQWASLLVPISLSIAIITFLATGDLSRSITVLVVFCPCALALATPVAVMAGIGQATKYGVLIKTGAALEQMGKVNCVCFDKTGTLTTGTLTVSDVIPFGSCNADTLLRLTALAERQSEHPIGKAICKHYENSGGAYTPITHFQMTPGKGITAKVDGCTIRCGKVTYLTEWGITLPAAIQEQLNTLRSEGKALVVTATETSVMGVIALSDELRSAVPNVVTALHKMDVNTAILTGDNHLAANHLAKQAGISTVHAELLPADKVETIKEIQQAGRVVCMLGDGVNDAPALKTAAVSVVMGGMGSDIAMDAADIALMGDDISKLPYLKRLSLAVVRSIRLNITLSMVINTIAITLSILGVLGPITGALVHNAGSVLVVLNAALLYDRKIEQ